MRRSIWKNVLALVVLALAGCHSSQWYNGRCETSANCARQPGFGKVCVLGQCQECGLDEDCKTGFSCRESVCVPRPECAVPSDCGNGRTCERGKCVWAATAPQCGSGSGHRAFARGEACDAGACRIEPPEAAPKAPGASVELPAEGVITTQEGWT